MMQQNDTDILRFIRNDARANLTTISKRTGIPVSTIYDRLRSHKGTVIKRFTALLDFAQLGLPIRTKIFLRVNPEDRLAIRTYLIDHEHVNSIWRVNNGFDFAMDCAFATIREVEEFLELIELRYRVLDNLVFHVIDDIVEEKFLTT